MAKKAIAAQTIPAFKGFDADWKCRGFQFDVGKTYKHDGEVKLCASGFHACEYPLDVFNYYDPTGKIAAVDLAGVTDEKSQDSKRVGSSVTIKAALTIPMLVSAAIEYTTQKCDPVKATHSKGDQSASSATGDRSASSATGYQSASSATGKNAVAMNIGIAGKAKAGKDGAIVLCNHDANYNIRHIRASKVGDNGIKPDVFYVLDDNGLFVEAA